MDEHIDADFTREQDDSEATHELEDISGVDLDVANVLWNAEYRTYEDIRKAEQCELAVIEGIGNALAARMKADVGGVGVDEDDGDNDDELDSLRYTFNQTPSIDTDSLTMSRGEIRLSDEDVPIVVDDDVDEIILEKGDEERTVDVDEVFGEEEMECTCDGPNEACSECPDENSGLSIGFDAEAREDVSTTTFGDYSPCGKTFDDIDDELAEADIDTEAIVEELEQESNEGREVCSAQYCENWADACEKH